MYQVDAYVSDLKLKLSELNIGALVSFTSKLLCRSSVQLLNLTGKPPVIMCAVKIVTWVIGVMALTHKGCTAPFTITHLLWLELGVPWYVI